MGLKGMFAPRSAAGAHAAKIVAAETELAKLTAEHQQAKEEATAAATDAAAYNKIAERVSRIGDETAAAETRLAELRQNRASIEEQEQLDFIAEVDKRLEEHHAKREAALAPVRKDRQAEEQRHVQALEKLAQREAEVRHAFKGDEIALHEVRGGRTPEVAEQIAQTILDIDRVSAEYPKRLSDDLVAASRALREAEREGSADERQAAAKKLQELNTIDGERSGRLSLLNEKLATLKRTGT